MQRTMASWKIKMFPQVDVWGAGNWMNLECSVGMLVGYQGRCREVSKAAGKLRPRLVMINECE